MIHSTPSLRGRGVHTRRIRRRRHLVRHGRVLVLVAVLSVPSALLSVRVGLVSLGLLHLAHIVSIIALLRVLLGYSLAMTTFRTSLCDSTAFCAATSVVVSLPRLTSDELGPCVVLLVPVSSCEFVTFFPVCWTPTASL